MLRVMILEDDPATGALLERLVKRTWPKVSVVLESAPEIALEQWRATGADLILLDWGLPGMNGLEVLKQIRESDQRVACVMISGHSGRDLIRTARAYQIDAFIVKPFDVQQVMVRLTEVMAAHAEMPPPENAATTLEEFINTQLTKSMLGLPIDRALVAQIEQIRELEGAQRVKVLRRCQGESALVLRLLGLANSGRYVRGDGLVETFEGALKQVGLERFIKLAVELSWYTGSHLENDLLVARRLEIQRNCMSLVGIVTKLGQHLDFDVNACRAVCLLHRVGELAMLSLMQAWCNQGHEISESVCTSTLNRFGERVDDQIKLQWRLPNTIRERIDAIGALPTGTVRKEPVVMRIAGLLHAGSRDAELPRLAARVGLSALKSVGG